MQPQIKEREVLISGGMSSGNFGISSKDQAHVLSILRDRLYSNKVLAVLREYSTNAWDAHRDAGIPDRPIKVALPNRLDPSLIIRDYGLGLSEEDIYQIYTQYGASTKRATDDQVGCYGIGSKSAFAYSDTFTITSYHQGMRRVYLAVLDKTNVGMATKLHEEPCGDETGVEIKVPVNPSDIPEFQREASGLFPYFHPLPTINIKMEAKTIDRQKHGCIVKGTPGDWVVVMGCVPYRLSGNQLQDELEAQNLGPLISTLSGSLYIDIGAVDIAANRESLEYTPRTKAAIVQKILGLVDEYSQEVRKIANNTQVSEWERRLQLRDHVEATRMPLPSDLSAYNGTGVRLYIRESVLDSQGKKLEDDYGNEITTGPVSFRLCALTRSYSSQGYRNSSLTTEENPYLPVLRGAAIFIRDNKRPLGGYFTSKHVPATRVVIPKKGYSVEAVEAELQQIIEEAGVQGIPIKRVSEMEFSRNESEYYNQKHFQDTFLFNPTRTESKLSDAWDSTDEVELDPEDVFVILYRFDVVGGANFYNNIKRDILCLGSLFGVNLPPIYGFKRTSRNNLSESDIKATPYSKWFADTVLRELAKQPEIQDLVQNQNFWSNREYFPDLVSFAEEAFGADHLLFQILDKHRQHIRRMGTLSHQQQEGVKFLSSRVKYPRTTPTLQDEIQAKYPLLVHYGLRVLQNTPIRDYWVDYVRMADKRST